MSNVDSFVLGLITEDEFSIWEIAGYVSDEFSLAEREAREMTAASLRRLVGEGLARLLEDPSEGRDHAQVHGAPLEVLDEERAWTGDQWSVRAFATQLGLETYLASSR